MRGPGHRRFSIVCDINEARETRVGKIRREQHMRCHLLMDADDTLWENNIYFEQAIHTFISFLNHSRLSRGQVRVVLDDVERFMGYGSANFTKSLIETYRRLAEKELCDEDIEQVRR